MGKLINEDHDGFTGQSCIKIEFMNDSAAVFDAPAGKHLKALNERFRLPAAMGLHYSNDHVDSLGALLARCFKHGIGFSDARCRAEKNLQLSLAGSLLIYLELS
jgi:hypothetical protein